MRTVSVLLLLWPLLLGVTADAQQLDIFDPDDFIDPVQLNGRTIFFSRLVVGASRGYLDQFRPAGQDVGFVHLANSLYWSGFQIDYKRSEVRGENPPVDPEPCGESRSIARTSFCGASHIDEQPAPAAGAKNLVQLSWYQTIGRRVTIRYRLAQARQYAVPETAAHVSGLKNHDDTRVIQIDTGVQFRRRTFYGTVGYTELTRHSSLDKTRQQMLTLGAVLPLMGVGPAILTPRLQIGGIAGVGPAIDVVNPSLDLSWTIPHVDANVHVIYSPAFGDLGNGTKWKHQVAIYADRAIVVPLGRRR